MGKKFFKQKNHDNNSKKFSNNFQILKDIEALKEEKRQAEQNYRNSMPSSLLQQQRLRVCEG